MPHAVSYAQQTSHNLSMMTRDTPDAINTATWKGMGVGWDLREVQQRTKARSATIRFPVSAAGLLIADTLCCVLSVDPNNPINAIQDSAVNNSIERLL
jgi:hypothetical protein